MNLFRMDKQNGCKKAMAMAGRKGFDFPNILQHGRCPIFNPKASVRLKYQYSVWIVNLMSRAQLPIPQWNSCFPSIAITTVVLL